MTLFFNPAETGKNFVRGNVFYDIFHHGISFSSTKIYARLHNVLFSICRGMFHGGDSDSTGVMAGCWYGAMYGFEGVPEENYKVRLCFQI